MRTFCILSINNDFNTICITENGGQIFTVNSEKNKSKHLNKKNMVTVTLIHAIRENKIKTSLRSAMLKSDYVSFNMLKLPSDVLEMLQRQSVEQNFMCLLAIC